MLLPFPPLFCLHFFSLSPLFALLRSLPPSPSVVRYCIFSLLLLLAAFPFSSSIQRISFLPSLPPILSLAARSVGFLAEGSLILIMGLGRQRKRRGVGRRRQRQDLLHIFGRVVPRMGDGERAARKKEQQAGCFSSLTSRRYKANWVAGTGDGNRGQKYNAKKDGGGGGSDEKHGILFLYLCCLRCTFYFNFCSYGSSAYGALFEKLFAKNLRNIFILLPKYDYKSAFAISRKGRVFFNSKACFEKLEDE